MFVKKFYLKNCCFFCESLLRISFFFVFKCNKNYEFFRKTFHHFNFNRKYVAKRMVNFCNALTRVFRSVRNTRVLRFCGINVTLCSGTILYWVVVVEVGLKLTYFGQKTISYDFNTNSKFWRLVIKLFKPVRFHVRSAWCGS